MAKRYNLAKMTTATTGTGTITLGAAVGGFLTFAGAGVQNGELVSYGITDGNNGEVGTGIYTSSGTTLTRNPTTSTNGNAAINLSGTAQVFITARAEDIPVLRGFIDGLTLSTAGSSITFSIAAGMAADSTNIEYLSLASALSKTTASWAVGSGNGGLDTGTTGGAASTWYHAFIIKRPDTGVVDALFSLSATAPTLPANYTLFRRIGSIKTDVSKNWLKFAQLGDTFMWDTPANSAAWTSSTTASLVTINVPTGVKVQPIMTFFYNSGAGETIYISSPDTADQAPSNTAGVLRAPGNSQLPVPFGLWTDTNGRVRARGDVGGGADAFNVQGWNEPRGRDA